MADATDPKFNVKDVFKSIYFTNVQRTILTDMELARLTCIEEKNIMFYQL